MARVKTNPILLLSQLDPTCQNGLIKESILLHQLRKTPLAVCTAIANQNDVEIDDLALLSFEEIKRQLDAIGRRYWIDWAVINGTYDLNLAARLIQLLQLQRPGIHILWNPLIHQTNRIDNVSLNNQEQELFQSLSKKVHTVFLTPEDKKLFPNASFLVKGNSCHLYVPDEPGFKDTLYIRQEKIELPFALNPQHYMSFLPVLACLLYEGKEMISACNHSLHFLAEQPIN